MKPITKSAKLANVLYDIRGPIMDAARQMEDEGQKIIKLNLGNLAVFGFDAPEEIQQDMIRNLPNSAGYSDSKGIFAARKAVMHETQKQGIKGVTLDDIYLGNGASELITMATNALLDNGDELLLPMPDYPLWTAATSLSGGTPVHYLCDEADGWMPNLADIRAKITPRTKAIMVVHIFGLPVDIDPILDIAHRHRVRLHEQRRLRRAPLACPADDPFCRHDTCQFDQLLRVLFQITQDHTGFALRPQRRRIGPHMGDDAPVPPGDIRHIFHQTAELFFAFP